MPGFGGVIDDVTEPLPVMQADLLYVTVCMVEKIVVEQRSCMVETCCILWKNVVITNSLCRKNNQIILAES